MKNSEIEFKWASASHLDFAKFLRQAKYLKVNAKPPEQFSITDSYVDADNHFFQKHRMICRIRKVNGLFEVTTKSFSQLKNGFVKRQENTRSINFCRTRSKQLGYVQRNLLPDSHRSARLQLLFTIQNKRTSRILFLQKKTQAELSFDRIKIRRGRKIVKMFEIELEFVSGKLSAFNSFTQDITRLTRLEPAKRSKVATAIRAFRL
jgi:inorganic triphosphatase YgiF